MKTVFVAAVLLSSLAFAAAAFGAAPRDPQVGVDRAAALRGDVKNFQLALTYRGQSDKPYYDVLLSVPQVEVKQADAFYLRARITEADALRLITLLETSGLLTQAVDGKTTKLQEQQPSYRLTTSAGDIELITNLGWSLETLHHLDAIRKSLTGEAATQLDTLLARLSGHRREWTAAKK